MDNEKISRVNYLYVQVLKHCFEMQSKAVPRLLLLVMCRGDTMKFELLYFDRKVFKKKMTQLLV